MKIAVIHPFGAGTVYGGPAIFLARLFEPLTMKHAVTVVYGGRGISDVGYEWATDAISLMRFEHYGIREQCLWACRAAWWLWRHGHDYDVIHIHGAAFFNLLSAIGAIARGRRYVLVALAEGGELAAHARTASLPGAAHLRRLLVRRASVGFALSEGIAAEFHALGLEASRVAPIFNPVDVSEYAPSALSSIDPRAKLRSIGSVGMVGERKRSALLLDVLYELRRLGWPATLVLVGPYESYTYGRRFEARMSELYLEEHVELVGYTREVAPILNSQISILLNPSSQEGMPGALAEAMASGVPVVVTDVGAMGDVVRSAGAGIVAQPDANKIAQAVIGLWTDDNLWRSHSRRARAFAVAHFDGARIAETYLEVLERSASSSLECIPNGVK